MLAVKYLCIFVAGEKCHILPVSCSKNELHEALINGSFEDGRRLIASRSEAQLVECFKGKDGCLKSCLHLIAAISDTEEATKLCRQLLQNINNALIRECLLNATTVEQSCDWEWDAARVAAVHIAAYSGNAGVVIVLCQEYGVDVNCNTSETIEENCKTGLTPLIWAAWEGHMEVVKVLLNNHADLHVRRTANGKTALHAAVYDGHTGIVQLMLEHQADLNVKHTDGGCTVLHIAAEKGHKEIVKLLLDYEADVNARCTDSGRTALYTAAHKGHTEIVKLLLKNNADVNARTADGEKPVDAARRNRYLDIVKLLQ